MTSMTRLAAARWDVRHAFRLQRFELLGFGLLLGVLAAAAVGVAGLVDATGFGATCNPMGASNPPACESMGSRFYDLQATMVQPVQGLLLIVPFLAGLVIGPPLVAREVERGTGRLAWSLAPSRLRWFVARLVPILLAVVGLGLLAGLALDRLIASTEPWTDPGLSFAAYGSRGVVFAARVVFVFAIGVMAGALLGRTLPALLVAAVVAWIGLAGGSLAHQRWLASEAVLMEDAMDGSLQGALYIDQRLRDAAGTVLTWDEAFERMPPDVDPDAEWPPADWTYLALAVPGERYPFVQAREVAALSLATLVFLGIAAVSVGRRRPG
jgi:hypothetical protein